MLKGIIKDGLNYRKIYLAIPINNDDNNFVEREILRSTLEKKKKKKRFHNYIYYLTEPKGTWVVDIGMPHHRYSSLVYKLDKLGYRLEPVSPIGYINYLVKTN